ncbi:hypothetical protein [Leptothermofonsia sp. ETS-13]|uniref:hypothetical protein n=1 Tax=Leptothermofonsia sp. ETS-13 TaxID=3035696 RepID=UPI003BA030BD
MKRISSSTFACRHCRYYLPEGRRGGHCQQLNAAVQGGWKACSLVIPPFAPSWENLDQIMRWQERMVVAQEAVAANNPHVNNSTLTEQAQTEPTFLSTNLSTKSVVGIQALWM